MSLRTLIDQNKKTTKVVATAFAAALIVSSVAFVSATNVTTSTVACNENASLTLVSLPSTLTPGQTVGFQVAVKNTGDTWFYHGSYFQLAQRSTLTLNPTYGHISPSMRPNDDQVEDFSLTAPTAAGTYTLNLQMVHRAGAEYQTPDGANCAAAPSADVYFGNQLTHTFTVSTPSNPQPTPPPSPEPFEDCAKGHAYLTGEVVDDGLNSSIATGRITNNSTTCTFPVGIASYKMFVREDFHGSDSSWLTTQVLVDSKTFNIQPGQTINVAQLHVNVPACRHQVDLFEGPVQTPPWYGFSQGHHLMDFAIAGEPLCTNPVTPPPAPLPPPPAPLPPPPAPLPPPPAPVPGQCVLEISKTVDKTSASVGDTLTYVVTFKNKGTAKCTEVQVWDFLDSKLTYTNSTNSSNVDAGTYSSSEHKVTWNVGTLDASESGLVSIRAKVKSLGSCATHEIKNTGKINSKQTNTWLYSNEVKTNVTVGNCPTPPPAPNPVPPPPAPHVSISIDKTVRNTSRSESSYVNSTNASAGEQVEFKIVVSVTGNTTANNVVVTDTMPSNFSFNYASNDSGITQNSGLSFNLGNMSAGSSKTLRLFATAASESVFPIGTSTWTNTASVSSGNAGNATDTAQVVINRSGTVSLVLSKRAFNVTQGRDATSTPAQPGDVITYTLATENRGTVAANNFLFEDDIADILQLSDLTAYEGATFNSSAKRLTWTPVTIQPNTRIEKLFTVKVKNPVPTNTDYIMTNVFGNEVRINVARASGVFIAPTTGSGTTVAIFLSVAVMLSFAGTQLYRRKFAAVN